MLVDITDKESCINSQTICLYQSSEFYSKYDLVMKWKPLELAVKIIRLIIVRIDIR